MTFEQSIVIAATPGELFALTQDYARRLTWDPFLKSAELIGGAQAAGRGVRAYCVAKNGLGMETEYVSFNPPRLTAVKMTRGPWLIARFAAAWRFSEVAPGQTQVGFRYSCASLAGMAGMAAHADLGLGFCSADPRAVGRPQSGRHGTRWSSSGRTGPNL